MYAAKDIVRLPLRLIILVNGDKSFADSFICETRAFLASGNLLRSFVVVEDVAMKLDI